MQVFLIAVLLFALLVSVFAVQNATTVTIRLLFWTFEGVSLSLIVLGSVATGAIIAFILGLGRQWRLSWRVRELTAKLADMQHQAAKAREAKTPGEPKSGKPK